MTLYVMNSFGEEIRLLRTDRNLLVRTAASQMDIDPAILSKIENGKRKARRELVHKMEVLYDQEPGSLIKLWLSSNIVDELEGESDPESVLRVAEKTLAYRRQGLPVKKLPLKRFSELLKGFPAIRKAWIFGSYARGEAQPESDLDIMIEINPEDSFTLFDLADVSEQLRLASNMKIDLVLSRSVKSEFKDRIIKERRLFYESGS